MGYITKIKNMKKKSSGYWAGRLFSQLEYAAKVSKVNSGAFDGLLKRQ